jgi:thiamine biosynthesis protein ThiS
VYWASEGVFQERFFPKDYNNPRGVLSQQNQVTINGEKHFPEPGTTLLDVVRGLGLEPERVAIELNRGIVKRELWQTTPVEGGAEIEIVQFVGGG